MIRSFMSHKEPRYGRWQRNETSNFVRAYLICIDEITVLEEIFYNKVDFFEREDTESGKPPHDKDLGGPRERVVLAEHAMEESEAQCKRLEADLRESMNSVTAVKPSIDPHRPGI